MPAATGATRSSCTPTTSGGAQRYHLELAPAGADDTAPGVFIANYARVRDSLDGRSVDHVDLYRFDVTRRSVLFLHLRTPGAFDLVLLDAWGNVIRCECDGRGGRALHKGLRPGRFFVAIRSRDNSTAAYTLLRASRTITTSRVRVNGAGSTILAPRTAGDDLGAHRGHASTARRRSRSSSSTRSPAGSSSARCTPPRSGGAASVQWVAPTVGRWRATATYDGTRAVAPSATGFVKLLVAGRCGSSASVSSALRRRRCLRLQHHRGEADLERRDRARWSSVPG